MNKGNIVIVDYGMGNLYSVYYKLKKLYRHVIISSCADEIMDASKIILPGVGHFATGMKHIKERNLLTPLQKKVMEEKVPVLGICLGMQLMTIYSEEGNTEGLGWFDATTIKFDKSKLNRLKIPHMGWNNIHKNENESPILNGINEESMFYFVHSYYVLCKDKTDILCTTNYDFSFTSGIIKENRIGVQFHPEKSHEYGMQILKNFIDI